MNRGAMMLMILLPALSGCRWNLFAPRAAPVSRPVLSAELTAGEVVSHLNSQSEQLRAWRCGDTKVYLRMPGLPMPQRLSGSLACEAPGRFRLVAGNVVGVHADLGANEEQGWVYVKPGESMVLTWRHEDSWMLSELMPGFPQLDPAWLMQLLGVEPISAEDFQLEAAPEGAQEFWLTAGGSGLSGVERRRIRVDRQRGEVREQQLCGSADEVLVQAVMTDYRGNPGERLPHQLRLSFPQTDTELTLTLGRIEVNSALSSNLWQAPTGGSAQVVDLRDLQRWSEQQRARRDRIAGVSRESGEFNSAMLEAEENTPAVGAVTPLGRGQTGGRTRDRHAPAEAPEFDVPRRRRWYWPWQR
ncbi:MAG: hypothetical protein ACKO2L_14940 [Planctomycetaceae bacterium]